MRRTREHLFKVHYRRGTGIVNTLPLYAPTTERAYEMAALFGERSRCEIVEVEQVDSYVLRFGAVLPKTIYV